MQQSEYLGTGSQHLQEQINKAVPISLSPAHLLLQLCQWGIALLRPSTAMTNFIMFSSGLSRLRQRLCNFFKRVLMHNAACALNWRQGELFIIIFFFLSIDVFL